MKGILFFLFSTFLFSEEYLKLTLLSKEKEFLKEYDHPNIPKIEDIHIKEGFLIYYPNGKPPIVYKFKGNKKEIFFEEKNLIKFTLSFKECEDLSEVEGFFKVTPEKEIKDFPFDKNYYFLLLKDLKEIYLKEGNYKIEELEGKYFYPKIADFKENELIFYPSFKSEIFVSDQKGERFDFCKSRITYEVSNYGKRCEDLKNFNYKEGSNFYYTFPSKANIKFDVFCEGGGVFSKVFKSIEIGKKFFINLNRLGKIEGLIKDKKGNPVKEYPLSIYYNDETIPLKETKTDEKGYFAFNNLKSGDYIIKDSPEYTFLEGKYLDYKSEKETMAMIGIPEISVRISPGYKGTYFEEKVYLKEGEKKFIELEMPDFKIWEGKVLSELNEPIPDVSIYYEGKEIGKTDFEGKFKIEIKEGVENYVTFSKIGYSIHREKISENLSDIIILKGLGTFKAKIYLSKDFDYSLMNYIFKELKIFKEDEKITARQAQIKITKDILDYECELEEGTYTFKILGKKFKPFTSSPFTIYSGKDYDYGTINLELKEKEEEEKQIKILIKNPDETPAYASVIINIVPLTEENSLFLSKSTNENGLCIIDFPSENFYYDFLYAESEKGFILLEKEELEIYKNLFSFEINLKVGNSLKIKIENLEDKNKPYELILRFKNGIIKEKILFGEEKIYKNLISPVEIEILFEDSTIWKERIELKEGENLVVI